MDTCRPGKNLEALKRRMRKEGMTDMQMYGARPVFFDPREGKYYDPLDDVYLGHEDILQLLEQ